MPHFSRKTSLADADVPTDPIESGDGVSSEVRPATDGRVEEGDVGTPEVGAEEIEVGDQAERRSGVIGWLQRMAHTKVAFPLLMLLTFADACVSPLVPEVMLVPMCLARRERIRFYGISCSIASVLGGCFGFWLGAELWESGLKELAFQLPGFNQEGFESVSSRLAEHTFFWIFVAGFTPLPFKLFAVTAGVMSEQVDFWIFLAAAASSRTLRFMIEVWLIKAFGPKVLAWLEKRLKLVLILAGIGTVAYFLWR